MRRGEKDSLQSGNYSPGVCAREKFVSGRKCQDRHDYATLRAAVGFLIAEQGDRRRDELQNFRAWRNIEHHATPLTVEAREDGTQIVL